jgi:hypothetical protein
LLPRFICRPPQSRKVRTGSTAVARNTQLAITGRNLKEGVIMNYVVRKRRSYRNERREKKVMEDVQVLSYSDANLYASRVEYSD